MGSPLYYGYREDCKVFLESLVIELAIFKASSAIDLTFPLSRSHSGLLQVERKWIPLRPVFLNVFVGSFPATTITTNCTNSASVGEPINVEAWQWYHGVVGKDKCTVVDTWWQTGILFIGSQTAGPIAIQLTE